MLLVPLVCPLHNTNCFAPFLFTVLSFLPFVLWTEVQKEPSLFVFYYYYCFVFCIFLWEVCQDNHWVVSGSFQQVSNIFLKQSWIAPSSRGSEISCVRLRNQLCIWLRFATGSCVSCATQKEIAWIWGREILPFVPKVTALPRKALSCPWWTGKGVCRAPKLCYCLCFFFHLFLNVLSGHKWPFNGIIFSCISSQELHIHPCVWKSF